MLSYTLRSVIELVLERLALWQRRCIGNIDHPRFAIL